MKYSRKCLVCDKEVIASNKRTFVHPECKDHPTPPVEAKTAEEIAMEGKQPFEMFPDLAEDIQYAACNWKVDMSTWNSLLEQINKVAMEAYHAQFTPSAKSVEVEEGFIDYIKSARLQFTNFISHGWLSEDAERRVKIENLLIAYDQMADKLGQQQKQADTISRLEEENQVLRSALNQDKTGLAKGLADVRKLLDGYQWICEGRGPYAWNDERYKKEVLTMLNDIEKVAIKALRESGTLATKAIHFRVAKEALKEK